MAKLKIKQIQARTLEILETATGGIRWGELLKTIHAADPETPPNTIHGALQALFSTNDDIIKVARGTYQLAKYVDAQALQSLVTEQTSETEGVEVEKERPGPEAKLRRLRALLVRNVIGRSRLRCNRSLVLGRSKLLSYSPPFVI